tara:strand:+ start:47 stop:325 length:279 start_codon:yes stop_codon:yes gene_type:complete
MEEEIIFNRWSQYDIRLCPNDETVTATYVEDSDSHHVFVRNRSYFLVAKSEALFDGDVVTHNASSFEQVLNCDARSLNSILKSDDLSRRHAA